MCKHKIGVEIGLNLFFFCFHLLLFFSLRFCVELGPGFFLQLWIAYIQFMLISTWQNKTSVHFFNVEFWNAFIHRSFRIFFFDEQNTKTHSIENNTQMESMKTVFLLLHKKNAKQKSKRALN